ncbi:MAG TPA: hypothetical protein VE263_19695 [Candidatus Angelobacter sp.]|nr:hypothetical protein [Candidatus Angelobacter sp.]
MNARITRVRKEVRALFWPWCAVVIAGALPVILPHDYAEPFSFLSFFLGVPLLATLSLGNEFHHRTFSLWLTQPFSRIRLWGEKMSVMCPAVLSAGLVSGIVMFSVTWPHMRLTYKVAAIVYVLVTMASATLWTLTAKSTLGALALVVSILFVGSLFSGGVDPERGGDALNAFSSPAATITLIVAIGISIAAVMLWLGAQKIVRFQMAGGSADGNLLMTGPALMPEALAEKLRCRPSGAFLNLIRKELRLLRPLWLIELLVFLYIACLAIFRLLPAPPVSEPRTVLEWVLLGPLVSVCIAMAGIAGILSLGEERSSGTHAWHMTLPISTGRQWLIKLVVAMLSGLACSLLLPILAMIAGGAVFGAPFQYVNLRSLPDLLIIFTILTFSCFWCACAANGTVRAVVWMPPVITAILLASSRGLWLGQRLSQTTGAFGDLVLSSFHLSPLAFAIATDFARSHVSWLFVPTLLFALIQSYRLFQTPPQDGVRWMLRCALPLVAVAILWSFSVSAGFLYSNWRPFEETRHALDRLQPGVAEIKLSGEDLAKGSSLTTPTRRWLKGSRISVAHDLSHVSGYVANIHLASGQECRLTVLSYGGTAASCGHQGR